MVDEDETEKKDQNKHANTFTAKLIYKLAETSVNILGRRSRWRCDLKLLRHRLDRNSIKENKKLSQTKHK